MTVVPFEVINGMSGSKVTPQRTLGILRRSLAGTPTLGRPVVVGGCEFGNIAEHPVLDTPGWRFLHDPTTSARAGSLLAIDTARVRVKWHRWRLGCPRTYRGRTADRMQTRYLLVARLIIDEGTPHEWRPKIVVGHAPPKRNWFLRGIFFASIRARRAGIVMCDWNATEQYVADHTNRNAHLIGVLGFALRKRITVARITVARITGARITGHDIGGDHQAVRANLRKPVKKEKP